jgi:hypothetical protein
MVISFASCGRSACTRLIFSREIGLAPAALSVRAEHAERIWWKIKNMDSLKIEQHRVAALTVRALCHIVLNTESRAMLVSRVKELHPEIEPDILANVELIVEKG